MTWCPDLWIGLYLFNEDTCPSGHVSSSCPRPLLPHGITRPQWVKSIWEGKRDFESMAKVVKLCLFRTNPTKRLKHHKSSGLTRMCSARNLLSYEAWNICHDGHQGWMFRDNSVYVPSQWEMALQCNTVSHWLGAYTARSLVVQWNRNVTQGCKPGNYDFLARNHPYGILIEEWPWSGNYKKFGALTLLSTCLFTWSLTGSHTNCQ